MLDAQKSFIAMLVAVKDENGNQALSDTEVF